MKPVGIPPAARSVRTVRAGGRSPVRLAGTAHTGRAWRRGPPGGLSMCRARPWSRRRTSRWWSRGNV